MPHQGRNDKMMFTSAQNTDQWHTTSKEFAMAPESERYFYSKMAGAGCCRTMGGLHKKALTTKKECHVCLECL